MMEKMLELNKKVLCPYCGNVEALQHFLLKYSGGTYQKNFVKCRLCKKRMRLKTVNNDMSFYEWGKWIYINIIVYNSPNYKFYDDVKFNDINMSLYFLGKYVKDEFYRGFNDGKELYKNHGFQGCKDELDNLNIKYEIFKDYTKIKKLNNFT